MDVFMFLRMYEGKMMSVFSKKLKSLINYMNHWAHRFLLHLAYFLMRCGIYFLLSMLSSKQPYCTASEIPQIFTPNIFIADIRRLTSLENWLTAVHDDSFRG